MSVKPRGCLWLVLGLNVLVTSAFLGTGAGWVGWILPTVLIAVSIMFVHMVLDVVLLLTGAHEVEDYWGEG
jgi:hypothetical protein